MYCVRATDLQARDSYGRACVAVLSGYQERNASKVYCDDTRHGDLAMSKARWTLVAAAPVAALSVGAWLLTVVHAWVRG